MNPKVSILVPIHNVSPFIVKCAESLFNQTFEDIEYIFVNDATPDDSMDKLLKVIDRYPDRKEQTSIIHHNINKGSAAARNSAIDASRGDFISFVDSDDYIDPEMIETLYNKAITENADVVVCNLIKEFPDRSLICNDVVSDNPDDNFINMIMHKRAYPSLCNKLIHNSLYKRSDCCIPERLNYCEDWFIMIHVYYFAKKIVKTDRAFYHYLQQSNSITKTINRMHFENVIQFWTLTDKFLIGQNIIGKYQRLIEFPKVESKVHLMIDTHSSKLRRDYATMFQVEETHCFNQFKRGERLMLLLVHYRLFCFAQLFHNYLITKNFIKRKLSFSWD